MADTCAKRKRSVVTLEKKIDIIRELKTGVSQRDVAKKFSMAKSTIGDIWKDCQKIEDRVVENVALYIYFTVCGILHCIRIVCCTLQCLCTNVYCCSNVSCMHFLIYGSAAGAG